MRKRLFVYAFLVVLAAALGLAGCSKSAKPAAKETAAPPRAQAPARETDRTGWPVIVAFGDSLTYGQGVAVDRNYPSQLQAQLDQKGYQYRVVNAGISGDTSAGGLNRVDAVIAQKPRIVILELGPNDGLQGLPVAKMKANLQQIIERLQKAQITVVLAGMEIPPNMGPDYTAAFQQTFPDLAKQYKLPLIPFFLDGVAAKPELNQMDGIHPTAQGYVFVVKNVMNVLEPLLTK